MHCNQHSPEEEEEAGKIVALKKSNRLRRNPELQENPDQDRTGGEFQKKSWHADESALRAVFFPPALPGRFPQEWARDQQDADEATKRADERAVRWQRCRKR